MTPRVRAGAAVFDNACRLWAAMENQAVDVGDLNDRDQYLAGMCPTGTMGIWVGALTQLCTSLGMASTSAYHETKLALVQMRCMSRLRRGAGQRSSAWALLQRPSRELWEGTYGPLERPTKMEQARSAREHGRSGQVAEVAAGPLSPEQTLEAVRQRVNSLLLAAVDGLADVLAYSDNAQAKTAAARTILQMSRDGATLDDDSFHRLARAVESAEMRAAMAALEAS